MDQLIATIERGDLSVDVISCMTKHAQQKSSELAERRSHQRYMKDKKAEAVVLEQQVASLRQRLIDSYKSLQRRPLPQKATVIVSAPPVDTTSTQATMWLEHAYQKGFAQGKRMALQQREAAPASGSTATELDVHLTLLWYNYLH